MKKGDIVSYMFDTGAMGLSPTYGVVIQGGRKTFTVVWESGNRNRVEQGHRGIRKLEGSEIDDDVLASIRRILQKLSGG
jgi:hypothetical protein